MTTTVTQRLLASEAPTQAGTTPSFDALYHEHFDFVWRSLRRLGIDAAAAEDAAQDAFVILHRRLGDLRPDASAKAFVFGIARRVACDHRRRWRRKGALSFDADKQASRDSSPFDNTAKAQAVSQVERFLAELDEDKRVVFVLAELEEMTAAEIGEALGVNSNTVSSRLRVARERFVLFMRSQGERHG